MIRAFNSVLPFYYGWIIVLITFISSMTTAGIGGYGLSFFLIPMSEELGVSRTEFSAISLFRLISLPVIPFLGFMVDKRHGGRTIMALGGLIGGISLISVSQIDSIWQFFLSYGIIFGFATTAIGGQLVGPAVLSKWFINKRGRVMAISAIGISGGGLVIAPIAGILVQEFGWRTSWIGLGILMIVAVVPISAIFMRRQPEDMDLFPDGVRRDSNNTDASNFTGQEEVSFSTKEAIKTKALWALILVQSLGLFSLMPTLFHQVAFMQDQGFTISDSTKVATTLAGFAVVGKLVYGFFAERYSIRYVLGFSLIPAGMSLLILVYAQKLTSLYIYAVLHGISMGGFPPMLNVIFASYFGREYMGAIRGFATPFGNVVGAASPVLAAWMWNISGNYSWAFVLFAISWIGGGILALFTKPPALLKNRSIKSQ